MRKHLVKISTTIVLGMILIVVCASCTENFKRSLKTTKSNWSGGLEREVIVYDYMGDTLAVYRGKFDVKESPDGNTVYFDLDGKRTIIHGGILINQEK